MYGRSSGMLLLDPTHFHAQMLAFAYNDYTGSPKSTLHGLTDLRGKAFLHLQPTGIDIDYSCKFAQSDNFAGGNITNAHFAKKGNI